MTPRRRRDAAFTMYETILVMVIVMVFAGVAIPSLGGFFSSVRAQKSAEMLIAAAGKANAEAVLKLRRCRLCIVETPADGTAPYSYIASEPDPLRQPGVFRRIAGSWGDPERLQPGLTFESLDGAVEDATLGAKCFEFTPDGAATAGTIVIAHPRGDRVTITLDAVTARASILADEEEATR
jgi:type II secretory pathway pseudopilin PulG